MKFVTDHPLADPDLAARKLVEIDSVEPVCNARIYIELINLPFAARPAAGIIARHRGEPAR